LLSSLNRDQQFAFQTEFVSRRKDTTVAILLAIFLGGFGAHHFYLGRTGLGVLYLCFFWTLIPHIIALIECFFMSGRVREYNDRLAHEIVGRLQAMSPIVPGSNPSVFCTRCGKPMEAGARFCPACGVAASA
jgi:TM2 domain-containing membrane protein YozV